MSPCFLFAVFGDAYWLSMEWALGSHVMSQCGASSTSDENKCDTRTWTRKNVLHLLRDCACSGRRELWQQKQFGFGLAAPWPSHSPFASRFIPFLQPLAKAPISMGPSPAGSRTASRQSESSRPLCAFSRWASNVQSPVVFCLIHLLSNAIKQYVVGTF